MFSQKAGDLQFALSSVGLAFPAEAQLQEETFIFYNLAVGRIRNRTLGLRMMVHNANHSVSTVPLIHGKLGELKRAKIKHLSQHHLIFALKIIMFQAPAWHLLLEITFNFVIFDPKI